MESRRIKQIIYGGIFLIFFGSIFSGYYFLFLRTPASCFDNIQNQGEQGIDCGAPCATVCIPPLRPLEAELPVKILFPDPAHYALLAKIQNPNLDFGARSFQYTFTISDVTGHSFTAVGSSYIHAGEIKYLTVLESMPANFDASQFTEAKLVFDSPQWVPDEVFRHPKLHISQQQTSVSGAQVQFSATLVNDDTIPLENLTATAIFYNRFGQIAGVSQTVIDSVDLADSRSFLIVSPLSFDINPVLTQVFVDTIRP